MVTGSSDLMKDKEDFIMAFCSNCGHELLDGVKFCSHCGASTQNSNSLDDQFGSNEIQMRNKQQVQMNRQPVNTKSTYENPLKKKSGRIYAVILFILAVFLYSLSSTPLVILLSIVIIAGGVICLKKGYKFKLLTILALLSAGLALIVTCWQISDSSKNKDEDKYAYETESKTASDISSTTKKDTKTSTTVPKNNIEKEDTSKSVQEDTKVSANETEPEETKEVTAKEEKNQDEEAAPAKEETAPQEETQDAGGVDPDLKAFLDSYEAYIDEYVAFMNKYSSDPNNAIAMLDDYTKMMKRYADFTDKLNKYDTNTMSKADLEYYLDVTNRCSKKLLSAY